MANKMAEAMFLQIGRTRYQVADFREASAQFATARDEAMRQGLGPDDVPSVTVVNAGGKKIAKISWNGCVWPPVKWQPNTKPFFDPRSL